MSLIQSFAGKIPIILFGSWALFFASPKAIRANTNPSIFYDPLMSGIYNSPSTTLKEIDDLIEASKDRGRRLELLAINGFNSYILADPTLIAKYVDAGLPEAKELRRQDIEGMFHCVDGYRLQILDELERSMTKFKKCQEIAKEIDSPNLLALSYECLAFHALAEGKHQAALEKMIIALDEIERKDLFFYYHIQNSKAVILSSLEYKKQAQVAYREALRFFEAQQAQYFIALIRYNLSTTESERPLAERIATLQELVALEENSDTRTFLGYGNSNLGFLLAENKEFDKSIRSLERSLRIFEHLKNVNMTYFVRVKLSELYVETGNTERGLATLDAVDEGILKNEDTTALLYTETRADIAFKLGRFKEAYKYLALSKEIKLKQVSAEETKQRAQLRAELDLQTEELKTKLAQEQLEREKQKRESDRRSMIALTMITISIVIIAVVAYLLHHARRYSKLLRVQVAEKTRDIRAILDHIRQGIVTIKDKSLDFETEKSRNFPLIAGKANSIPELMSGTSLSDDEIHQASQVLMASLSAPPWTYDCNDHHLPREATKVIDRKQRNLEFDWAPIKDDTQGTITKILLSIRDVTEVKLRELERQKTQERTSQIELLLAVKEGPFSRFYLTAKKQLRGLLDLTRSLPPEPPLETKRQMMLYAHTLKGLCRTLGFKDIANSCHQFETQISSAPITLDHDTIQQLQEESRGMLERLDTFYKAATTNLGWHIDDRIVEFQRQTLIELLGDTVSEPVATGSKLHQLLLLLEDGCQASLQEILRSLSGTLGSLAKMVDKPQPQLEVHGPEVLLSESGEQLILEIFPHLWSNAIDHGIESVNERARAGKPPEGTISIRISLSPTDLIIRCYDDGRGLGLEGLLAKAKAKGLMESRQDNDQEIANLIFSTGLSSKSSASEISGRGVGLDAVKSMIAKLGGEIWIDLDDQENSQGFRNFQFVIELPRSLWWESHHTLTKIPREVS